MQNDFIDGALGTKEAQAIVSNVAKKIKEYKDAGKQVIFTRDTHPENYLETYEGKHLHVAHCVKNTVGWQISNKLDFDIENDILIDKSTFGWLNWKDFGFESVEVCGLCTDICVVSNALIIRAIPLLKPRTSGASISPFSSKNLPKSNYTIPESDLTEYKSVISDVPKNELLSICHTSNNFIKTLITKQNPIENIKADMKLKGLKGKEYIHSIGQWGNYINYLRKELSK